jgi:hypothetical protein
VCPLGWRRQQARARSTPRSRGHHTCQWKRSSPAGPALQLVGGSFWRSCDTRAPATVGGLGRGGGALSDEAHGLAPAAPSGCVWRPSRPRAVRDLPRIGCSAMCKQAGRMQAQGSDASDLGDVGEAWGEERGWSNCCVRGLMYDVSCASGAGSGPALSATRAREPLTSPAEDRGDGHSESLQRPAPRSPATGRAVNTLGHGAVSRANRLAAAAGHRYCCMAAGVAWLPGRHIRRASLGPTWQPQPGTWSSRLPRAAPEAAAAQTAASAASEEGACRPQDCSPGPAPGRLQAAQARASSTCAC